MLNEMVEELAACRLAEANAKKRISGLERELELTPRGRELCSARGDLREARDQLAIADANIRAAATHNYQETGEKTPHPAVKVQMSVVLYYINDHALEYCREHLPQALKLNKGKFEKAAKVLELDFVDIAQKPAVRIARNLTPYVEDDPA